MFKTVKSISNSSVKILRSEFIAFLYPVSDVQNVKELLSMHNFKYKDATHNCYAYVLGKEQETQYYSDQGEPSGTAGKPILNMLLKHNLTNVAAIVTRYYGGIKLGVRGLIDAYSEVTERAIQSSELIDYVTFIKLEIKCDYASLENLKHHLKQFDSIVLPIEYSDQVRAEFQIPEKNYSEVNKILDDLKQRGHLSIIIKK